MKKYHVNENGDLRVCPATKKCRLGGKHYPANNVADARKSQEIHLANLHSESLNSHKRVDFVKATPEEIERKLDQKALNSEDWVFDLEAENAKENAQDSLFTPKASEIARMERWEQGFSNYKVKERMGDGEKGILYADARKSQERKRLKKVVMDGIYASDEEKHKALMSEVNRAYREDTMAYREEERKERRRIWEIKQEINKHSFRVEESDSNVLEKDMGNPLPRIEHATFPSVTSWRVNHSTLSKITGKDEDKHGLTDRKDEIVVRFNDNAPQPKTGGEKFKAFFTDQEKAERSRRHSIRQGDKVYIFQNGSKVPALLKISPSHVDLVKQKLLTNPDALEIKEWSNSVEGIYVTNKDFPAERIPLGKDEAAILDKRVREKSSQFKKELAERESSEREIEEYRLSMLTEPEVDHDLESKAKLEGALSLVNAMTSEDFQPKQKQTEYFKYPV